MLNLSIGSLYTGQLVRLGAFKPEDKDAFSRWSHDSEYLRMLHFEPATPRPPAFFEEQEKKDDDNQRGVKFVIRTLADDKPIGFTGLWLNWNHQNAWFYIGIGEADYRGKGYGTDATKLVIGYAFRELGMFRVSLGVFGYNTRAIRAYEKAGFTHEGTQREALYREGKRWDLHQMGILRPEWEAIMQAEQQAAEMSKEKEAVQ
jgi:RimJ/RimL family protein N-acetyltransferase